MKLNEEGNVYGHINFGDGCLEGCLCAEIREYLGDSVYSEYDKESQDIVDMFPSDPFEMGFSTDSNPNFPDDPFGMDWKDLGLKSYGFETDDVVEGSNNGDDTEDDSSADYNRFAELDFRWTITEYEHEGWESTDNDLYVVEDSWCFGCEKYEIDGGLKTYGFRTEVNDDSRLKAGEDDNGGDCSPFAADMITFVLGYLNFGVKDLLTIEMVCKSLRDAVRKDPYLWTKIHIDYPLGKISNDDLLRLTDRAQGKLCSLGLVRCSNITNDGLQQVLERNLELTKLSVAGSIKLSLEGVLNNLRAFNSVAKPGIKHLRIGDIKHVRIGEVRNITNEHLRELKLLLGVDEDANPSNYKPRFYCEEEIYLSLDDERAIDIEECPRCQMLKQVYDCPTAHCRVTKTCKACIRCISRCIQCGCCLEGKAYQEIFNFEFLCMFSCY